MEGTLTPMEVGSYEAQDKLAARFLESTKKLCINPLDKSLERRAVHLLGQLLVRPLHSLLVWDTLKRTGLLVAIVRSLRTHKNIQDLLTAGGRPDEYMWCLELASKANPCEFVRLLTCDGTSCTELEPFFAFPDQLSLPDGDVVTYRECYDSFARILSYLLTNAYNCALLVKLNLSPVRILFDTLKFSTPKRLGSTLAVLRVVLQVLLHTASFTSMWIKEFSYLHGPTACLSFVLAWCRTPEDPECPLNNESIILFDILCMLLSLRSTGRDPDRSLYMYLRGSYWEDGRAVPCPRTGGVIVGRFGLSVLVEASVTAMEHCPATFVQLSRLLIRTLKAGGEDILAAGLLSVSIVSILRWYVNRCDDSSFGSGDETISVIVRLCLMVCASPEVYEVQTEGATQLCDLVVELASNERSCLAENAIKAILLLTTVDNAEPLFKRLSCATLIGKLDARLARPSSPGDVRLVLQMITMFVECVPSSQNKLVSVSGALLGLLDTEVENGREPLMVCAKLLTVMCKGEGEETHRIYNELRDFVVHCDFTSISSVRRGCWGLQVFVNALKEVPSSLAYLIASVDSLLECLKRLCVDMHHMFSSQKIAPDTFSVFSHGGGLGTTVERLSALEESSEISGLFSYHCQFLVLGLHVLCFAQATSTGTMMKDIHKRLEEVLDEGPFLQCRLYTSIVARTFVGMASLSSSVVFGDEFLTDRGGAVDLSLRWNNGQCCSWRLNTTLGDMSFHHKMQRLVFPVYLHTLQRLLFRSGGESQRALLGISVVRAVMDVFSNSSENLYILMEGRITLTLANLVVAAIGNDNTHSSVYLKMLVEATGQLGTYGVDCATVLCLLGLCVRDRNIELVEYDNEGTVAVLSVLKSLLQRSIACSEPMLFYGVSAGYATFARSSDKIADCYRDELAATCGVKIPIRLATGKPDRCFSFVLWFLLEPQSPYMTEEVDIILMSVSFDENHTILQLVYTVQGMLFVRVVQGGDEQCGQPHSKSVLVPNASLPTGKWCMLSVLLSQSRNKSGVMGSKYSLNVQLSLYTICQGENYPAVVVKTNDIRCIELDGADHSLRVVDAISLVSGDVGIVDYPRRFLLGSLGMFGGALSRLEVELLFVMGSDSLMSLSFMDDNFVNSLFPVLANVTQSNREKHGGQLLRLAIPWLAQGCADSKSSISISTTAFAAYRKKLRDVFVAGVRGADFHIVFSADHHDTPDDKCNISSPSLQSPLRSARGRWAWSGHCPSLSSSLDLSCDADVCTSGTMHGKIWLQFNATKILSSSPLYSMLDALGGIPFFLCLSSLQVPQSGAFSTAWACACSAIKWHSTDNLLSPRSQHGDQHLVILIRAMLYHRVKVSELVAVSLCDAIGHRLIIRVDLLPLILDFTAWTEDPAAFRAILARLQQYINDDVYGYFNRQVLDSGHNVLDTKSERSALEAFILHILMHFSGRVSGGSWDVTFIPFSVDFLTSLCRTVNDIRQILRAVSALLAACDTPTSDAVSWAAGLLDVVFYLMDMGVGRGEENTDVVGYVIAILGSSSEVVRCKALALLWYTPVSRVHLEAITNTYLARKDSLKDVDVLCDAEFSATLRIVKRSAAAGDTHRGRGFLYFLITLLAKVPNKTQKDILFLFDEIVCKKGSFENDLLSPCEANEFPITLIYGCLVQALPSLGGNGSLMESFVKLMTQLSVDIVSTSWKRNNAQCGSLLGSISLAYLIDVAPMLRRVSQEGVLDDSVAGTLIRAYRHAADVLRTYSIHAEKGPITGPFLESYLFFLKSTAAVVILISRCERDYRISDAMKVEEENWLDNALNEAYIMQFKRPIQFGRGCIGARLCVLFFEKAQKLFFQLQSSQSTTLHTRQIRRTCQRLLLLQWKVAAFLLNDADMKGNEFIKELILLHITNGGSALHGFKFSSWREREKLVEPPLNSDWRHLQFAPGALITELLRVDYDRVLKEVAPWLIICRGASGFLNESRRKNPNRFNMVVSVCRLVRYNKAIWSLVKGGIAPSSFSELDVRIKSNSVTPAGDTLNSFSTGGKEDTQWEVELCRSGVVSLERYISGIHSAALSSLNQLIQLGRFFFVPAGTKHGSASRSQVHSDEQAFRDSVVQWIDSHERYTGENAIAVLAAYAAYRFSLLPWWGQCVNIHAPSPVELDQWELDRFMGPEWQRIRFRRLIYDARIHHTQPKEHVIQCVHWESTPLVDDMELLRFYSVTAVPQLLSAGCAARQPFTVKCLLVLPMTRTSVLLSVSPDAISYEGEQVIPTAGVPPRGPVMVAPDSHPRETPPEQPSNSCESAIREVNSPSPNRDAQCRRRVFYPSDVRAVWRRRNLLRPCALEVLFATGESLFLAFDSSDTRDVVLDILVTVTRPYLDSTLTLSESNLKMWRNWWCEGCITNFHYLMYLNFAAGRSYGDMRQYPVFPHVVADFTSPLLDLNSPSTYRQFSRPIGAQTQESAQRAEKNYLETSLEVGMITGARDGMSSYHYGSHYSPLGGALHFLVRVQPFSDYFVEMNSKLDDAGRVFDSLAAAYTISTGGKDVKELLPEFYCLPNLLVNSNRIPFGTKQDGSIVDDVQLPPWAESPRDLVVTLRNALEGSYVSENLHLWIDLIFGYRQRGKEAVSALNVFHPLTYEGSVDLSAVTDPVLRRSHETQINCFGQTPVQLFLKPHRQRYESSDIGFQQTPCSTLSYDTSLSDSCILLHPTKIVPAGTFRHQNGTSAFFPRTKFIVVGATEERTERKLQETQAWPVVLPRGVLPFTVTNGQVKDCLRYKGNRISVVNGQDLSCEINSFYVGRGRISSLAVEPPTVYAGMESGAIHVSRITYEPFQRGELPSSDGSGTLLDLKDIMKRSLHGGGRQSPRRKTVCRTLCVLYGHTARVTALHSSAEWGVLVSLSEDCNAAIWDARRCVLLRVIPSPLASPSYVKHLARNTMTCHICSDERHWQFYLVTVNAKHGDIILAGKSPAYSHGIRRYTINGELLGTFEFGKWPAGALLSVGDIVFVAERRRVHVLRGSGLEWLGDVTHPGLEGSIESLALSPNGCVLAACDQEEVLVTWRVSLR